MKAVCCLALCLLVNTTAAAVEDQDSAYFKGHRRDSGVNGLVRRTSNQNSVRAGSEQIAPARQSDDNGVVGNKILKAKSSPARFLQAQVEKSGTEESRKRQRTGGLDSHERSPSPKRQRQSIAGSSPVRPARLRSTIVQGRSGVTLSEHDDSSTSDSQSRSPSLGLLSLSTERDQADYSPSQGGRRRTRANVRLYGPGVTVVGGSQMYPEYSNIRTGESTSTRIKDPNHAKAAGASYEHEGAVIASSRGRAVKGKVDARRSRQGGMLTASWEGHEPWNIEVRPGTKAALRYDDSFTNGQVITMKASLHGKGSVGASAEQDYHRPSPSPADQEVLPESQREV